MTERVIPISTKKFYDTNAVLLLLDKILNCEHFYLASTTLHELEHIKVSKNKSAEVKYQARKAIHILDENEDKYTVIVYNDSVKSILDSYRLTDDPDNRICACALLASKDEDLVFVTDDLCCKTIANKVFGLTVESVRDKCEDTYAGFKTVIMSNEEMAEFYENLNINKYNLLINEYLIIKNQEGVIVDKVLWSGEKHDVVKFNNLKSQMFGSIKPYNGDIYQQCILHSFSNNKISMVKGKPGTGKSYLALGFLFNQLEKHKIDKVVVFCNTVATKNSAKLGFYPGSRFEKLIDSAVGVMLSAKFGSSYAVEQLVASNQLEILPMCDIRGYDTTGMNAGIYITEAQNMDIDLMKLALQRIGDDCICIIDGDYNSQVDMDAYSGSNNGMRRMSEVFRGQDFYGEVELQSIYRSRIAAIAELM